MSNTSKGHGIKGSKYWMDILVNFRGGKLLNDAISAQDSTLSNIEWLSPLAGNEYEEYKLNYEDMLKKLKIKKVDLGFWANNQPQWDAIGQLGDTIILVEAKGHTKETKTKISATAEDSIELIKKSMKETFDSIKSSGDLEVWSNKYYQLGNRLTFLHKLNENGYKVKLVLLNFVNDYTNISTSITEWEEHYKKVFVEMFGVETLPDGVMNLFYDVSS